LALAILNEQIGTFFSPSVKLKYIFIFSLPLIMLVKIYEPLSGEISLSSNVQLLALASVTRNGFEKRFY
jgi:hypothetical protein